MPTEQTAVPETDEEMEREMERLIQGMYTGAPPAPKTRNAESDPKEQGRRENTQCQYCFSSKGQGAKLSKCGACKIAIYCSKDCQVKAWPTHKEKCKLNQRINTLPPDMVSKHKLLRAFTTKHRPMLSEAVVRAMKLGEDPSRSTRDLLMIMLRMRKDSKRTETAFFAYEAVVMSVADFHPSQRDELYGQMRSTSEEAKRAGALGTATVALMCPDETISNFVPVGFDDSIFGMEKESSYAWKDRLLTHMNEGIVL